MPKHFRDSTLDVPSSIVFGESDDGTTATMVIKKPCENMQNNAAAFEGWALLMKCRLKYEKVIVSFSLLEWGGSFDNLTLDERHYMRFLFRLWKFGGCMDWFEIAESVKPAVTDFAATLLNSSPVANYPESSSNISKDNRRKEQHVEKRLVKNKGAYINEQLTSHGCGFKISPPHDQLPNGLFKSVKSSITRIFPTGYFDIWAINDINELCIFELKVESNADTGIISELFFYAEYAKFVFLETERGKRYHAVKKDYRGYKELQEAADYGNLTGIQAVFLVEKLHPRLKDSIDDILRELNKSESIKYDVVYYDRNQIPQE
jgi:hypothetical protein